LHVRSIIMATIIILFGGLDLARGHCVRKTLNAISLCFHWRHVASMMPGEARADNPKGVKNASLSRPGGRLQSFHVEDWILLQLAQAALAGSVEALDQVIAAVESAIRSRANTN
jgi:hypothetical protein